MLGWTDWEMEGVRGRNEKRQQLSGQNENMWIKGASAKERERELEFCLHSHSTCLLTWVKCLIFTGKLCSTFSVDKEIAFTHNQRTATCESRSMENSLQGLCGLCCVLWGLFNHRGNSCLWGELQRNGGMSLNAGVICRPMKTDTFARTMKISWIMFRDWWPALSHMH